MSKKPAPLLGYNTNVRHHGNLFHIQTEDSGVDHPHIITHLFVEGTILATKRCSYVEVLGEARWENKVREMMKDQHRAMFVELRDGEHDEVAARIFGFEAQREAPEAEAASPEPEDDETALEESLAEDNIGKAASAAPSTSSRAVSGVRVIRPADMSRERAKVAASVETPKTGESLRYRSVFDTPDDDGEFGENLITDKSLDEVILSYLTDELDE
jgi:hypothetical protein